MNFLNYCLVKKHLAHSTIHLRLFAIALSHNSLPLQELSQHTWVTDFLKGAKCKCPRRKDSLPKWDLHLVLQTLRGDPFEPMLSVRINWLILKNAFLLAITTAKRVGEMQAFSQDKNFLRIDRDANGYASGVYLKLNPFFIPKVTTDDNRESEIYLEAFCRRTDPQSHNTLYMCCVARA